MINSVTQTPALDKAVRILDYLAKNGEANFSQISEALNLPKSSTHILLTSLRTHGLLRMERQKYFLGMRLYEWGNFVEQSLNIKKNALPLLTRLRDATDLTCHLGVLEHGAAIYLLKLETQSSIIVRSWVGKRLSLYSSGLGKVLLAWQPPERVKELVAEKDMIKHTHNTITSLEALEKELDITRERGWGFDNEEDSLGVFCLAAPVFDKSGSIIAAISISGVSSQIPPERIPILARMIMESAGEISEKCL